MSEERIPPEPDKKKDTSAWVRWLMEWHWLSHVKSNK